MVQVTSISERGSAGGLVAGLQLTSHKRGGVGGLVAAAVSASASASVRERRGDATDLVPVTLCSRFEIFEKNAIF